MIIIPSAHGIFHRGGSGGDSGFGSVEVLLHLDGSHGSSTITNNAPSTAMAWTTTVATLSTTQSVFGGASWNGITDSFLSCGSTSDLAFGTADFTIEMRVRFNGVAAFQCLWDGRVSEPAAHPAWFLNSSGLLIYYVGGVTRITSGAGIAANTWYAMALSRVSGTTRMFIDGVQSGSNFTDTVDYLATQGKIGNTYGADMQLLGYVDEVRVTKGIGHYAANYTIATAAFPDS